MNLVRIPRRIDELPHVLLWSADEMIPIFLGMAVGMFVDRLSQGVLVGLVFSWMYKKFRDLHPDGFVIHMLYWYGFDVTKGRLFKNPMVKNYLP